MREGKKANIELSSARLWKWLARREGRKATFRLPQKNYERACEHLALRLWKQKKWRTNLKARANYLILIARQWWIWQRHPFCGSLAVLLGIIVSMKSQGTYRQCSGPALVGCLQVVCEDIFNEGTPRCRLRIHLSKIQMDHVLDPHIHVP